jgi:hypothetical protein
MKSSIEDTAVEFAKTHRWRFNLGKRKILYAQSVAIKKTPTWFSKGYFVLNMYGVLDEDFTYVLDKNHNGQDARIELTDGKGNPKVTFKLSKVKIVDEGYTKLVLDYRTADTVYFPVTFSFKKIEVEDANL